MLCKNLVGKINGQFLKNARSVTTDVKKNAETVEPNARLEYYKHLNDITNVNVKPAGWDEALPFEKIPGPKAWPLIGNIWRFMLPKYGDYYGLDLQEIHRKLRDDFGDVVVLKGLPGRPPMVHISNPDDIETLMRNEGPWPVRNGMPSFTYYRTITRKDVFKGCGGVTTMQGEDWFKFRSAVNPVLMQPRNVLQYVQNMDMVADELVDNMRYFSTLNDRQEMPEDFITELHKWALESIGVVTMDKHLGCLQRGLGKDSEPHKLVQSVLEMFDLMYKLDILPSWWRTFTTKSWKRYVEVLDYLTKTNMKHIDAALENIKDKTDLPYNEMSVLQKLLTMDRKVAVAMSLDMMIAGVDTTGRTLGAALYYLARHPEKQEAFREEVLRLLPSKTTSVTKETISAAPYLKAIVKETTRLAPIAVGNLRSAVKDIVLGGYRIPKGTEVLTMNLIQCIEDKYFPRSKEYIPERWLKDTTGDLSYKNTNQFIHLPFGFGPRSCIGKRLANMELEVALLKIIRNFKLEWMHEDMVFKTTFLHGVARPLRIRVSELDN